MSKVKMSKMGRQSKCIICKMRVQVNGNNIFTSWGHSRYPMDHPATPNRGAIRWAKKLGLMENSIKGE